MLEIVASYHFMQFPGKLMIQTQENGKEPQFGPDLGPSNGEEPQFGTDLGSSGPSLCYHFFFFFFFLSSKIWLCQSLDTVHVHLSSCKISEKPNDLILRKFSDGRTDRWTDG